MAASPVEGLGVFALRGLRAAETILRIDDSREVTAANPLGAGEDSRYCDYLAGGRVVLMQPPERHINHSCDPNTFIRTLAGVRELLALRDIAAGEEITCDYCINSSGDTLWHCSCGAARCRGRIHSDFFQLPRDLQFEYLPLLDDWFVQENSVRVDALRSDQISNSTDLSRS